MNGPGTRPSLEQPSASGDLVGRRTLLSVGAATLTCAGMAAAGRTQRSLPPRRDYKQLEVGRDEPILDPELAIVDAHHHLFVRPGLRYMADEYLADARAGHRVVASVYVEASAFPRPDGPELLRPLGEIEFANGIGAMFASGDYGDFRACAAIVGYADLTQGDRVADLLDQAHALAPNRFRGIRQTTMEPPTAAALQFMPNPPAKGIMHASGFRTGFGHLAPRKLTFDAAVFHHQIPDVAALADAFPDTTIVLNHCGVAYGMGLDEAGRTEVFCAWRRLCIDLARRQNVVCKVGGLGLPFWGFRFEGRSEPIGYRELAAAWRPYVETAIGAFGPNRCMMESNYPPDSRSAGFVPAWNSLKHIVRAASAEEKRALFSGTAERVYRLDRGGRDV